MPYLAEFGLPNLISKETPALLNGIILFDQSVNQTSLKNYGAQTVAKAFTLLEKLRSKKFSV